jgi:lipoprotein-anchoring transpeptidase ErfK/SrfK
LPEFNSIELFMDNHDKLPPNALTRRAFALGVPLVATGCSRFPSGLSPVNFLPSQMVFAGAYGAVSSEQFPLPAVDLTEIDPEFQRSFSRYAGREPAGSLIVDTSERHLYLIMESGRAIRYGVGVGREGLAWSGRAIVGRKAEWPRWTPTADMIAREPERNARWAGGMEPGLRNPLGARALYLYRDGRDTLYRIHGTNEPSSIGQSVSSGCIRMINQDVIDLHQRVGVGTPVLVT